MLSDFLKDYLSIIIFMFVALSLSIGFVILNYLFSPNGQVTSILTKEAFTNLLHPIQPFKFGIKTFAAKMAIKHEIDLIIYGEPYAEYGSSEKKQTDDAKYDLDWLVNDNEINIAGLSPNELKKKYQWIINS